MISNQRPQTYPHSPTHSNQVIFYYHDFSIYIDLSCLLFVCLFETCILCNPGWLQIYFVVVTLNLWWFCFYPLNYGVWGWGSMIFPHTQPIYLLFYDFCSLKIISTEIFHIFLNLNYKNNNIWRKSCIFFFLEKCGWMSLHHREAIDESRVIPLNSNLMNQWVDWLCFMEHGRKLI